MRERDCPEGPICLQAAKVITCNFEGGGIIYIIHILNGNYFCNYFLDVRG